jgi:hypothetical protein
MIRMASVVEKFPIASSNPNPDIPERVLYYKLRLDQQDPASTNSVRVVYNPSPALSYLSIRHMSNEGWMTYNDDLIEFSGQRTPESIPLELPAHMSEICQVRLADGGYLSAQALYDDSGSGPATSVGQVDFTVLGSSGSLSGAKVMKILYDNVNAYRTIVVTF